MPTARKIGAVVIIALSALVFVGCIAVITGAWIGRSVINAQTRQLADQVLELTDTVNNGIARVEDRLNTTLQRTQAVRDRAQAFAARDLSDTAFSGAVRSVAGMVTDELSPAIERVSDAVETVSDRLQSLNRIIRITNLTTGSDLPTIQPGEIAIVNDVVTGARTQVAALNTRLASARIETRQDVAADITRLTAGIDSVVQPVQQRVVTTRTRIAALDERVNALPGWLDSRFLLPLALGSTFFFGWLAVGQLALIWLGWLLFMGRLTQGPRPAAPELAASPRADDTPDQPDSSRAE